MAREKDSLLALDIGGANIKAADGKGRAVCRSFPLWRNPRGLEEELRHLLELFPKTTRVAVTMTGELADCFPTKADGVRCILGGVRAAGRHRPIEVYLCDGRIVDIKTAEDVPLLAAASNWHALAKFCSRFVSTLPGLLIDIGSTTCDVIPLEGNGPSSIGRTDPERLTTGELVYTGVERSPLCGVTNVLPWGDRQCPVAQEVFATTLDVYLTLGDIPEAESNQHTADGRERTRRAAHRRIARSICADETMYSLDDAVRSSKIIRDAQISQICAAARQVLARMPGTMETIVLSGTGEFLGQHIAAQLTAAQASKTHVLSLADHLGPALSQCGPAHALAVLASEAPPR